MTPEKQIKALAELDGWTKSLYERRKVPLHKVYGGTEYLKQLCPDYLTSYDAIIPLIQKQDRTIKLRVSLKLIDIDWMDATTIQLCEALLRAVNKWEE